MSKKLSRTGKPTYYLICVRSENTHTVQNNRKQSYNICRLKTDTNIFKKKKVKIAAVLLLRFAKNIYHLDS